jgi:hypothetical protein
MIPLNPLPSNKLAQRQVIPVDALPSLLFAIAGEEPTVVSTTAV